ncbi:MAG TPA: DUF4349 domain-containing protein, partial [Planctomycetota bacterium]|nr:DUF4349 domain-containing protein [Planctomycetota bacterium]
MLIHRGAMTLEVARPEEAIAQFLARVQEWGGYLSSQQDQQVTVRLPAAKFETAFAELRQQGRVLSMSTSGNDVTKDFLDLGIRLENAQKSRARLLELLQKADEVEDM